MKIPFEKSFASHEKAKYWSYKNTIKPIDISNMTKNKYIFNCDKCNHELYISIQKIVLRNQWCPYCCNNKLCSSKNGKHVIRIYQEDIYNNKNDWDNKLLETINNLLTIEIPTIRYIGEIYTSHVLN
jgi:hypothetical protein